MTRAELRLELIRIAHHPAQSDTVTLDIARRYEEAFADLILEAGGAERAPALPRKAAKAP